MKRRRAMFLCLLAFAWWTMGCATSRSNQRPEPPGGDEPAPQQAPSVSSLSIKGYLRYDGGARGKRFYWRLRFYENTGLVLGSGNDRDGRAEFFGIYSPRTQRFLMTKRYRGRRGRRTRVFYYRGVIRRGQLVGTAHSGGFRGRRYAFWRAGVSFQRLKFDQGRSKRFLLRGLLRYNRGNTKRFVWAFKYYPSSGSCFGLVSDRDGRATFSGVYDRQTNRFFLRKHYGQGRTFYYIGIMTRRGAIGIARRYSFMYHRKYAVWKAVMVRRR